MNNLINNIKPFSIVSSPYIDLTGDFKKFPNGDIQRGLFMVARIDEAGNVLAFKITSQRNRFINDFTYNIPYNSHPFLRTDSFVQLDKWHTLNLNECTYIGDVKPSLRMAILRKYDLITRDIDKCFKDNMPWGIVSTNYISPNIKNNFYKIK
jgi:hypothetical protein